EQIRSQAIETLLKRIIPNYDDKVETKVLPTIDIAYISVDMNERRAPINFNHRQRAQEMMNLENWTNREVLAWCESLNLPSFSKLLKNFDGQSVIRLHEFCKPNSTETISLLNNDLHNICQQENTADIQISVHEFIQFQIEVEKLLQTKTIFRKSSLSISTSRQHIYKGLKIKTCSIL
ncbi:unnamed protein product, partial [Rotaria magnacalcarata]